MAFSRFLRLSLGLVSLSASAFAQQTTAPRSGAAADDSEPKRIFWIIPNYRSSPLTADYKPLTVREKFTIATQDSFDRGTVALGLLFGAQGQISNSNPSFGQGVRGFAHYAGTAYGDYVIGDYMTEAVFPTVFRQDPRYFRRGTGSVWSRIGYSAGQIFITHGDSGHTQFNVSEIGGNAAAVAISMAYYPENRDAKDAVSKLGTQIAVDMASNMLREFVPDLRHKVGRKKPAEVR